MQLRFAPIGLLVVLACSQNGRTRTEDAIGSDSQQNSRGQKPPAQTVTFATPNGDVVVEVEVVATAAKITKGLMYREYLAPESGMLFLMGGEAVHEFYMRNTLIPLDMIFITRDFLVAGVVENAAPRTETHRSVGTPSLYVLEVNGGWAATHHVTAGTKLRFGGIGVAGSGSDTSNRL